MSNLKQIIERLNKERKDAIEQESIARLKQKQAADALQHNKKQASMLWENTFARFKLFVEQTNDDLSQSEIRIGLGAIKTNVSDDTVLEQMIVIENAPRNTDRSIKLTLRLMVDRTLKCRFMANGAVKSVLPDYNIETMSDEHFEQILAKMLEYASSNPLKPSTLSL